MKFFQKKSQLPVKRLDNKGSRIGDANAFFAISLEKELKAPGSDGLLLTKKDVGLLLDYTKKNRENKSLVKQHYKLFFREPIWLGTIMANAAEGIPIGAALRNGYLTGKQIVRSYEGFLGSITRETEYQWKFPVSEDLLKAHGFSLESKDIFLSLDVVVDKKLTVDIQNFNNTYTTEILFPEYVQIFKKEDLLGGAGNGNSRLITKYYGQDAYVGLVASCLVANPAQDGLIIGYGIPEPNFMSKLSIIGKHPKFNEIISN